MFVLSSEMVELLNNSTFDELKHTKEKADKRLIHVTYHPQYISVEGFITAACAAIVAAEAFNAYVAITIEDMLDMVWEEDPNAAYLDQLSSQAKYR